MKITKYPQSCFLIETSGKRILIDPGCIDYSDELLKNDWKDVDLVLITHKHGDHCHLHAIKELQKSAVIYTTKEVNNCYPEIKANMIVVGDIVEFESIKIEVVKAVHGYHPILKSNNNRIFENVGYIIEDKNVRLYHTSDSICFYNEYKCDVLLVPICNHAVVMGPWEASLFAKDVGAKLVVPMHYDSDKHPRDLNQVEEEFKNQNLNYKILSIGESIEFNN
ncbi:MAG: MBL fold metallo-hydrolase [bacterium]